MGLKISYHLKEEGLKEYMQTKSNQKEEVHENNINWAACGPGILWNKFTLGQSSVKLTFGQYSLHSPNHDPSITSLNNGC